MDEVMKPLSAWGDLVLTSNVQGAVKDLDADLGRRDGFDGLPHHAGYGGFPMHLIPIPRGSMSPIYHNIVLLP